MVARESLKLAVLVQIHDPQPSFKLVVEENSYSSARGVIGKRTKLKIWVL